MYKNFHYEYELGHYLNSVKYVFLFNALKSAKIENANILTENILPYSMNNNISFIYYWAFMLQLYNCIWICIYWGQLKSVG